MSSTSRKTRARSDVGRELPATILVGRVLRAHGLRGELLVEVLSERSARFRRGSLLILDSPGVQPQEVEITTSRAHGTARIIGLAGVEDRDQAESLRGSTLEVRREELPEAPAGAFYIHDLVGCQCADRRLGEVGEVIGLIDRGGGWLLIVAHRGRELLVPFVESMVVAVDVRGGRIELDLPEGLVDACASPL